MAEAGIAWFRVRRQRLDRPGRPRRAGAELPDKESGAAAGRREGALERQAGHVILDVADQLERSPVRRGVPEPLARGQMRTVLPFPSRRRSMVAERAEMTMTYLPRLGKPRGQRNIGAANALIGGVFGEPQSLQCARRAE
jgi:hypothetical protein